MAHINVKSQIIRDLFENKNCFFVPEYQRKFEWDEDNFINLIIELSENNESTKTFLNKIKHLSNPVMHKQYQDTDFKNSQIFLGNIVLKEQDIVDGQQRLTSIMLIMKAISDIAKEKKIDFNSCPFINAVDSYICRTMGGKKYPLITSNAIGQKGVNESIVGLSDKKIQKFKISKLFNKAKSEIEKRCNKKELLESMAFKILSIQVIVLSLEKVDQVFDIFEKLNSKSTQLSPADLIKNKILSISNSMGEYKIAVKDFLVIDTNLKNTIDLTSFIRMISIIYKAETVSDINKAYIKKNSIYKDVFEKEDDNLIWNIFQKIKSASFIYEEFFVNIPKLEIIGARNINLIKRFLDTKKTKILSTLTLYLSMLFKKEKLELKTYIYLIKWLENFYLRMFTLANNPAKEVDKHIPRIIFAIHHLKDNLTIETIKEIFNKFLVLELKDEESPYKFITKNMFTNEKSKHLLLKLYDELEGHHSDGVISVVNNYMCQLEHLLPKKSIKWIEEYEEWNQFVLTGKNDSAVEEDGIYKFIHQLGNHFIVKDTDNIVASNDTLDKKLPALMNDGIFKATWFIEEIEPWTPEKIKERTQKIQDLFTENNILSLD